MKKPTPVILVDTVDTDDDDDGFSPEAWLIARAIAADREQNGAPEWPSMLAWSRHPEGVLVDSDGDRWLIRASDFAGVQRLAGLIRMEFAAGCAGKC